MELSATVRLPMLMLSVKVLVQKPIEIPLSGSPQPICPPAPPCPNARVLALCPNPFIAVRGSTRPSRVVKVPSDVAESPSPRLTG